MGQIALLSPTCLSVCVIQPRHPRSFLKDKSNQEFLKLGLEYFNYTGFLYEDDETKSITKRLVVQGSLGTTTLPDQHLEFCAQLGQMAGCLFGNRVSRARDETSAIPQEMRKIRLGAQNSLEDINYLLKELPNFTWTSGLPPSPALSTIKTAVLDYNRESHC